MSLRKIRNTKGNPSKSVVLLNFDEIMNSLVEIDENFRDRAFGAMGNVGGVMATLVQDRTPVRFGNLKGAIKEDDPKIFGDEISVEVTSGGVEYAEVIEFGYEDGREIKYNVEGFGDVVSSEGARMFTQSFDSPVDHLELQEVLIQALKI